MAVLVRTLLVTWCAMVVWGQKTQVTRTALHVARSLNPEATETMTVRTRTGDVATLIVKRRSGRQQLDFTLAGHNATASPDAARNVSHSASLPRPVDVSSAVVETKDEKDIKNVIVDSDPPKRESKTNVKLPEPVFIRSSPMLVKGQQNDLWKKRSRSLTEVGPDGIPVVTGVRMPDDESDKQVWRNARVIDGMLRPYDKTQPKHTFDTNSHQTNEKKKTFLQSGLGWQQVQPTTQRPANEGFFTQKDEWQNTEPVKQAPPADFRPSEVLAVIDAPAVQEWHQVQYPQEVVKFVDEPIVKIPAEEQYIRDRILEYIKRINQQELMANRQQARNSRMIAQASEQPKMEARVLHTPGASVYPTSLLYSPPSSQPSHVSFEEGVRTPVLQYAHPELGVQSANVVTTTETEQQPETEKPPGDRRDQALAYFAHDIHSDRSPYAFEPGLEEEAKVEDYGGNAKRSHSGGILQRPKKYHFYPDQSVSGAYNTKHYGKYGYNDYSGGYGGGYYAYQVSDGRPFWERLSDTIKGHVQTGLERMTDMTRPVVEPLMEASHKISENLGFASGNRELSSAKEKLGIVGTPSILLPALGLVAGGAALGLGAVAVGRYLDVDLLKRSKDSSDLTLDDLPAEHKRAIEAISRDLAKDEEKVQAKSRERRSAGPEDVLEEILQSLEGVGDAAEPTVLSAQGVWNNTPCAKRVFCEVMVQQPHDAVVLMEKKMATYLQMIHPSMTDTVGFHLDDVMSAVRNHDCSAFRCSAAASVTNASHQRPSPR